MRRRGKIMRLIRQGDAVTLFYGGRKVFEHTPQNPFVTVTDGKISYRSSHGSFKVKEKRGKRTPLMLDGASGDVLSFSGGGYAVELSFSEDCGGLNINFRPNGRFMTEMRFAAVTGEGIFGGGEQYRQLNMKGEKIVNLVSEHIVVPPVVLKTVFKFVPYKEKPHSYIRTYSPMSTYTSSGKYALRFETSSYGVADFTSDDVSVFRFAECPKSVFFTAGADFASVAKSLARHTPSNVRLPEWCHDGMIVAVQGGSARVTEKVDYLLKNDVKVCGVWSQDWSGRKVTAVGKQVYWNWEADEKLYPNFDDTVRALHEKGVRFLAYINPYLVKGGRLYNECAEKGMLIRNVKGEIYHIKSTTFDAGMLDLTNPAAAEFIKETLIKKNMLDRGVDGYMADFGEYLPVDSVLHSGDPAEMHNEWPVLWAKINREAVDSHPRGKDVFFFTRSGYNGVQEYSTVMWNGDQHTDFTRDYGMPCVIPATFNLGFSGFAAVHSDVGGFISFASLVRSPELLVRWTEMNAFSPLMRSHETIRPDVNVQPYDERTVIITASLSRVHAALAPYLVRCMDEARQGIPVMRPDFYESGDFSQHSEDYAYLLGSDVFVAPVVTEGAKDRTVTLPPGDWVKFFDGERAAGGKRITVSAPLGRPVAFYRQNSEFASLFAKITL